MGQEVGALQKTDGLRVVLQSATVMLYEKCPNSGA